MCTYDHSHVLGIEEIAEISWDVKETTVLA